MSALFLQLPTGTLSLERPRVMAILNLTPDSFSGDGLAGRLDAALRQAEQALQEGADLLDIGGESSRPGAAPVGEQEELDRVMPVLERLVALGAVVSVDTCKPVVMRAAITAGAAMVNDINALREVGAVEVVASSRAAVCLMHMQGEPRTMQAAPDYADVVSEVTTFLQGRSQALERRGCHPSRIVIDPGFGFGKRFEHNQMLFRALPQLCALGYPVLVGVSRKSMLGHITGRAVGERMPASVAAAVIAAQNGATILRVHDVAATVDALRVQAALGG